MHRRRWMLPVLAGSAVTTCVFLWWRSRVEVADTAQPGGAPVAAARGERAAEPAKKTPQEKPQDAHSPRDPVAQPDHIDRTLGVWPNASSPTTGAPASLSLPNRSKVLLRADASPSAWALSIARFASEKNVVALQAIAEAAPGRTREERAQLAALSVRALASLGAPAKPAFDDLLASPDRTIRLAALNAYAVTPALYGTAAERQRELLGKAAEPDPVIRAKARALLAALR